ncbi:MAG: hypothetical protein H0T73_02120 [Ardenticatenales bacterium]|nr:hypothetical protein [Ardenticatenales bacterium]
MKPKFSQVLLGSIFAILLLVISARTMSVTGQAGTPDPSAPRGIPTPWPTMVLPPMTPVISDGTWQRPAPSQADELRFSAHPTPPPHTPYHLKIEPFVLRVPLEQEISGADVIVRGTVRKVLPSRWTTPGGVRPSNPFETPNETIFTPVLIEVEEYLKGKQPQLQLLIFVVGGIAGQDAVEVDYGDPSPFREGQQLVLFLSDPQLGAYAPQFKTLNEEHRGQRYGQLWTIYDYFVVANNRAVNSRFNESLDQLIATIRQAAQ